MKKIISIFCLSLICMVASAKLSQEQIEFEMNISSALNGDGFVGGYSYNWAYYWNDQNGWIEFYWADFTKYRVNMKKSSHEAICVANGPVTWGYWSNRDWEKYGYNRINGCLENPERSKIVGIVANSFNVITTGYNVPNSIEFIIGSHSGPDDVLLEEIPNSLRHMLLTTIVTNDVFPESFEYMADCDICTTNILKFTSKKSLLFGTIIRGTSEELNVYNFDFTESVTPCFTEDTDIFPDGRRYCTFPYGASKDSKIYIRKGTLHEYEENGWLNVFDRSCFIEGGLLTEEENNNDDKDTTIVIKIGEMLFTEDFSDLSKGNSKETNSSPEPWNGNNNFPNVGNAFQAGGAVKLGGGSSAGSMTSSIIDFEGGNVVVEVDVKGWTKVEGTLLLSMTGSDTLEVPYKATMSDEFETVQVLLTGVSAQPSLTIQTSKKRCFIDEVRVYRNGDRPKNNNDDNKSNLPDTIIYSTNASVVNGHLLEGDIDVTIDFYKDSLVIKDFFGVPGYNLCVGVDSSTDKLQITSYNGQNMYRPEVDLYGYKYIWLDMKLNYYSYYEIKEKTCTIYIMANLYTDVENRKAGYLAYQFELPGNGGSSDDNDDNTGSGNDDNNNDDNGNSGDDDNNKNDDNNNTTGIDNVTVIDSYKTIDAGNLHIIVKNGKKMIIR